MRQQDKEQELLFFDVDRETAFDLHEEQFHHAIEARMERHTRELLTGHHRVLEAGCGTGAFARHFIRYLQGRAVWEITGVDIAPAMIAWNARHPQEHFHSIVGDLENAALFAPETFDLAVCPMVLHHFPDPRVVLRNITAWLKPGGCLYIIEPNGSSPVNRLSKFIRKCLERIMGLDYTRRFASVNETDHTMRAYMRWLGENNLVMRHRETCAILPGKRPAGIIHWSRYYMYKVAQLLWQPLRGNMLIVFAQKPPKSQTCC